MARHDMAFTQGDDVQILYEAVVPDPDDPDNPVRLNLVGAKIRFAAYMSDGTAAWKLTSEADPPAGWTHAIDAVTPHTDQNVGRALIVVPRAVTEIVPQVLKYDIEVEETNGRRTTTQYGQIRVAADYA